MPEPAYDDRDRDRDQDRDRDRTRDDRDRNRDRDRNKDRGDRADRDRDRSERDKPDRGDRDRDRSERDRTDRGDRTDRYRDRERDRDRDSPPIASANKRLSITDRIRGTFSQARKDTSASVARRTSTSTKQNSPIPRIREWLETCNTTHADHCAGEADDDISTWRPEYFIDTIDHKLVEAKDDERYVALSYVWGPGFRRGAEDAPLQLLKANLEDFEEGIPEADIPKTIMDAIWLAKKLGLRYIWVDRLCIVQDDESMKESHIRHMAYVFSNAYLTIIAAHGDVQTGLLPLNPRRPTRVASGNREHNDLLLASKWNTRGWTLQELLYSRRAVFFFEDTVTWECHCDLWQSHTVGISKFLSRNTNNNKECTNRLSAAAFGFQHSPWPDLDEYARIAADYSSRRVTLVDDTLKAFSGITHVLSRVFPGGFMYGMPLMFLDIALLWRPQASIRRRALTRPPFLPSWSWMGWWFDGIPVDLTLWKVAADYVEESRATKRGQPSKRFQAPSSFRIKPTVTWALTDRASNVPVINNGLHFRELRSRRNAGQPLPPGWTRSGAHFKHDSDNLTTFKYPIPVEDPPDEDDHEQPPGEVAYPGPLLSFTTQGGIFDVDFSVTLAPKESLSPPVAVGNIWSRANKWIGEFRAHDGWLGVQSSNYDGDEKLEFIAISTAMERRGSVTFPPERFEENVEADGIMDIVNVLWIERIGGVAYRRGSGHVLRKAWDAQARDDVDIILG